MPLNLDDLNEDAAVDAGADLLNAGRHGAAIELLSVVVDRWPDSAQARLLLGAALWQAQNDSAALDMLSVGAELAWDEPETLYSFGWVAAQMDKRRAWPWLLRVGEVWDPETFDPVDDYLLLCAEVAASFGGKSLHHARDLLAEIVQGGDDDGDQVYVIALAHVHRLMDEPEQAAQIARDALQRWPDDPELRALADGQPIPAPQGPTSVPRTTKVSVMQGKFKPPA